MLFRFMNDGNIKWCKLLYAMNLQLLRKISRSTETVHARPACLIVDDTDEPKSVRKHELITSRRIKCHLIGMLKLGKTKFHAKRGNLTAKQIIKKLQKQGLTKSNKTLTTCW